MYTGEAISINKMFSTTNKARGQIVNKNRGVYTINGLQANEVKNKKKTEKYIKCSQLNTCIHGRRNGGTHQNLWGEGFINENVTIFSTRNVLLISHKLTVDYSSTRRKPIIPHVFGLHLHDLTQIHTIPWAMQRAVSIMFIFGVSSSKIFIFCFHPSLNFTMRLICGFRHISWILTRVCAIVLILECLILCI